MVKITQTDLSPLNEIELFIREMDGVTATLDSNRRLTLTARRGETFFAETEFNLFGGVPLEPIKAYISAVYSLM